MQGRLGVLTLASVGFLIFARHLKVKKLLLALLFIASAIVSPFQGLVMVTSSKGIAQGSRKESEGVLSLKGILGVQSVLI